MISVTKRPKRNTDSVGKLPISAYRQLLTFKHLADLRADCGLAAAQSVMTLSDCIYLS